LSSVKTLELNLNRKKNHLEKHLKSIVIIGAFGFLGTSLSNLLAAKGIHVHKIGRASFDLHQNGVSSKESIRQLVRATRPDAVVNLAALTDVDLCERDTKRAFADIVRPLDALQEAQKESSFGIIQISTDQVYSGTGPHSEISNTQPINAYGKLKLVAEGLLDTNRDLILRTNFIGRSKSESKTSWTDWLYESLRSGREIHINPRIQFSPLHVTHVCNYILLSLSETVCGLFNLGSATGTTKVCFAREFASDLGLDGNLILERDVSDEVGIAPRPLDLRLDSQLFESRMNLLLPDISSVRRRTVKDYISASGT
jgi:dTDP-4-dehydrorhamnose reductase